MRRAECLLRSHSGTVLLFLVLQVPFEADSISTRTLKMRRSRNISTKPFVSDNYNKENKRKEVVGRNTKLCCW